MIAAAAGGVDVPALLLRCVGVAVLSLPLVRVGGTIAFASAGRLRSEINCMPGQTLQVTYVVAPAAPTKQGALTAQAQARGCRQHVPREEGGATEPEERRRAKCVRTSDTSFSSVLQP